jgi:hypothetical protein
VCGLCSARARARVPRGFASRACAPLAHAPACPPARPRARAPQLYAFVTSSSLLIKVKRAELRTQHRAQQPAAAGGGAAGAEPIAAAGDAKKDR